MPTYSNGYIPENLLVTFATGWSQNDGNWKHQLSPAAYARHLALVKRARDRTGRTLQVANGWGAYRPYYAQVIARNLYGNGAATPGTSSHGGFWEGRQTLATDYSNWGAVYGWDQDAFFADCRAVGLWPGMIMRSRGYPDEPWHVVDPDPWGAVPAFDGVVTPFPTSSTPVVPPIDTNLLRRQKEDTMYVRGTTDTVNVYNVYTDPNGISRLRLCAGGERATAQAGGLVIVCDDATLTRLGIEGHYRKPYTPSVNADVTFTDEQLKRIGSFITPDMTPEQVKQAVAEGMRAVIGTIKFSA